MKNTIKGKNNSIVLYSIILFLLVIVSTTSTYFISKSYFLKDRGNCSSYKAKHYLDRDIESGYENTNMISYEKAPIYKLIENYRLTYYKYCELGIDKNGERIMAPYTSDTGCIYTEDVCEKLLDEKTKIGKADISKCN